MGAWSAALLAAILVTIMVHLASSSASSSTNYYHYNVEHPPHHQNPYTQQQPEPESLGSLFVSNNDTFTLRKFVRRPLPSSPSSSSSSPSTEWTFANRSGLAPGRQILVGYGPPLATNESLHMAPTSNIQTVIQSGGGGSGSGSGSGGGQPQQQFGRRQPLLLEQQSSSSAYPSQENLDISQTHPLPYYQCDNSIIHDQHFIIESPNYPAQYPANRICSYYIAKNRSDVCQIEVTISDMDIEDTAQCTADYVDFGPNHHQYNQPPNNNPQPHERLCGLMLRNTRRFITFPPNSSYIRITFHSDGKNDRPYRGFSAEVQQIPNSCNYTGTGMGIYPSTGGAAGAAAGYPQQFPISTSVSGGGGGYPSDQSINPARGFKYPVQPVGQPYPVYPGRSSGQPQPGQYPPMGPGQQYPTGVPYGRPTGGVGGGGINTGYGQRLYPPQHPVGPGVGGPNVQVYDGQVPNAVGYSGGSGGSGIGGSGYPTNRTMTPIYLASYCDVYLGELNGEIRSPNYPFGYPTNHSCVYTIKKAGDDVCQVELIFHHFDIQTPNAQKDLTDNCHGDYLQMPDGGRLCGYYTQSMSGDYKLKKYYAFPETSEFIFMHFFSDAHQTPDGSGFWLEVKQLPNTCKPGFDYHTARCDRVITGQYSEVDRIYSPNYPQFYGPRQQCAYFVQPMDSKTCEFELDLVQFSLEQPTKQDQEECRKDFLQLPDRRRICGQQKFRRIFSFPKYHDRTAMFYFQSDDQIEDRGFEIVVRQIPNSCGNYTPQQQPSPLPLPPQPGVPGGPGPWNTNVYVQDPNLGPPTSSSYLPPTPIFTYDNSSGLQPYQPPGLGPGSRPTPGSYVPSGPYGPYGPPSPYIPGGGMGGKIPGSTFGRKSSMLPSYWDPNMPNPLNDPRNVDSSGTIPLYFANGTLATRIPPMKPVDMISMWKKGKTVLQKGSSGRAFPVSTIDHVSAIANNRYPHIRSSSSMAPDFESDVFQSSARLKNDDNDQPLPAPAPGLPSYSCDQTITRPVEYIRSPNFPNNYPVVSRCIYSIVKSDNSVCQIRLHLLQLDLEYTSGCKNDYLLIEPTGEKLCGRINQPEVRWLNYYGYSRDIRLIFNSDRQTTRTGFEVRIEQVPNSCDDLRPNATWNSMIGGVRTGSVPADPLLAPRSSSPQGPDSSPSLERLRMDSSSISAQALTTTTTNNQNATSTSLMAPMTTLMPAAVPRVCQTTSTMDAYLESENFPLEYPSNVNCVYKIFRANRQVCRLELEFEEFNVGDEATFDTAMAQPATTSKRRPVGECLNDYLEIDGIRYCGQRRGQPVAINFPKVLNEIHFRFVSSLNTSTGKFNGFRIRVRQIDENCRSSATINNDDDFDDSGGGIEIEDFSPAIIESCPKLSNTNTNNNTTIVGFGPLVSMSESASLLSQVDPSMTISEEVVKIQSPQFGLPSQVEYGPFLDCYYVIQKVNRNICSLEIRFEVFALEESSACRKDYLEINGIRFCGKLPMGTIKVFEFFEQRKLIHFHTDSDQNEQGFAMILKQIRC